VNRARTRFSMRDGAQSPGTSIPNTVGGIQGARGARGRTVATTGGGRRPPRYNTAAAEERPSFMASRTRTVLIVDEDRTTRDRLSGILGRHYRVLVAATGEAAFALLMKEQAEIVLLDVCLPGISGLDALRILRENYPLSEVIMISALGDIELAVQAMKQGAYHYVTKDVEDSRSRPC